MIATAVKVETEDNTDLQRNEEERYCGKHCIFLKITSTQVN